LRLGVVAASGRGDGVGAVVDGERRGVLGALLVVAEGDCGVVEGREVVGVLDGDGEEEMPLEREVVLGRSGIDGDGLSEGVVERGGGGDWCMIQRRCR